MRLGGIARTHDWDEASSSVAQAYFAHRLTPVRGGTSADQVAVGGVDLGPVRIAEIGWGAPVVVRTAHPGGYAVNLPLSGSLGSLIGDREVRATPAEATVYAPDTEVTIVDWPADCRILGVRFEADRLRAEAQRLFARAVRLPDGFATTGLGRDWLTLVRQVSDAPVSHPLLREQLAGAITTAFLLATVPNEDPGAAVRPRIVRRVVDAVRDDPARAWTAAEMAETAGVGVRRLQEGFREYLGVSPREYLVGVRLERVHAELAEGAAGASVTETAMRWGFAHVGRFAAQYRERFGETPSATLRRASGR